jgi:predicted phosphodiesterase
MEVRNEATRIVFTIGVQVVTEDNFAHLGAIAKLKDGKMYIMRGYTDEMKGTKIPDNMVVKPMNRRYITDHGLRQQGLANEELGQMSDIWDMRDLHM